MRQFRFSIGRRGVPRQGDAKIKQRPIFSLVDSSESYTEVSPTRARRVGSRKHAILIGIAGMLVLAGCEPWPAGGYGYPNGQGPPGFYGGSIGCGASFGNYPGWADHGFVTMIQGQLRVWSNNFGLPMDGCFSQADALYTGDFQAHHGLTVNGVVDPNTWALLFDYNTLHGAAVEYTGGSNHSTIFGYSNCSTYDQGTTLGVRTAYPGIALHEAAYGHLFMIRLYASNGTVFSGTLPQIDYMASTSSRVDITAAGLSSLGAPCGNYTVRVWQVN